MQVPDNSDLGRVLLAHARAAIGARLSLTAPDGGEHLALSRPGATFVTLTKGGQLRGCIGTLSPVRSLLDDVRANAQAAAFDDPRFAPMTAGEWPFVAVEVSVLGPVSMQPCPTRQECLSLIGPEYGVILSCGIHRATFLPQVWEQLPDPNEFLDHLLRKGGFSLQTWPEDMMLGRYRVEKFHESSHESSRALQR